jgi:hypothetical protein
MNAGELLAAGLRRVHLEPDAGAQPAAYTCSFEGARDDLAPARLRFTSTSSPLCGLEMILTLPDGGDLVALYEELASLNVRAFPCTLQRDPATGRVQVRSFVVTGDKAVDDEIAGGIRSVSSPVMAGRWVQVCFSCCGRLVDASFPQASR